MAPHCSHQRGSTVFFNFSFPHCTTKESEKNSKFSKKKNIEALVISIKKTTQVTLWTTEQLLIIIWRRKELSNLDRLKGFSMYLGGNCRWVPLLTIA